MLIGPGEGLTPIDFVFFRSRVKVTRVTFVKKWFPLIFLTIIYYRAFICNVLRTPIDFGFTRSKVKVTMVIFVTNNVNMVFAFYLENCLTLELSFFTC